jgi:4-amino-4-deoxy-L-arabinose transferase-like glycosyltransferase
MLAKVFSAQESHGAPPGYYLLLFWVTFWPAAAFGVLAAPAVWAGRRERDVRFLLAWLVPAWLVFELVITKLPHYVLPLYPAIAILIARTMERGTLSDAPSLRWVTVGWPLWAAVFSLGGIVLLMVMAGRPGFPAWPFAAGAILLGVIAWRAYEPDAPERALVLAAASAILIFGGTLGVIAPSLRVLFPSPALARAIPADCPQPLVASAGYHEPSLVFLVGTSVKLTDGAAAADFLREGLCRFAFVESRQERVFARRAEAIGLRYSAVRRVDGVNINGGRSLSIGIYRSGAAP